MVSRRALANGRNSSVLTWNWEYVHMSTYVRTGLAFPAGDGSIYNAVDPQTGSLVNELDKDVGQLAQAFADGYVGAGPNSATFGTGSGSSVTVYGSWAYDSATSQVSGYVNEIQHSVSTTGGVLETVDNFQFDFSVTYDAADPSQSTGDFSQFANLFAGDDNLSGGSLGDVLKGFGGNDTIIGHGGADHMFGGDGNDVLSGGNGADTLYGGSGNDKLTGRAGNDHLIGGNGADHLSGGTGADVLDGGHGRDHLLGGGGHDTFVFEDHFGHDTISDFSAANAEKIDLSHVTAITGFTNLIHHHLDVVSSGAFAGDAEIVVGAHNSIVLHGVNISDIGHGLLYSAHDFIF